MKAAHPFQSLKPAAVAQTAPRCSWVSGRIIAAGLEPTWAQFTGNSAEGEEMHSSKHSVHVQRCEKVFAFFSNVTDTNFNFTQRKSNYIFF